MGSGFEDRLKTIKSLVFVNLKFKIPTDRGDRGQILQITPHSLDCSRAHDDLWILPLAIINDVEMGNKESVHVGECQSCKSRILTCLEGDSTTTHEFLIKFIPQTTIEMKTEVKLGPISYWAGNENGVDKLSKDTGYNLFKDFDAFEHEQDGPHSTDYIGIRLKEIVLSSERLDIFQTAMGNSLETNILVIGASILTTIGSQSSDSIYLQPVWLPDQTKHAEPKPTTRLLLVMKLRGSDAADIGFLPYRYSLFIIIIAIII